ncbi:MAG: hypothetical protein LIO45_08425 [Clostridiales bacterium]|nr:hypothetical protein [Clostridiales bacterium]
MENVEAAVFTPHCQELVYDWEGIPVLTCRLSLPQKAREEPGLIRIDRYYRHVEDCIRRWLEGRHAKLCTLAQDALCASRPIPTERVLVDYQAEQTESGLLDICWTVQWEGKRRRFLDCWEPKTGAPVKNCVKA